MYKRLKSEKIMPNINSILNNLDKNPCLIIKLGTLAQSDTYLKQLNFIIFDILFVVHFWIQS